MHVCCLKWENFNWTKITGGESFVFFYDEDKLRICTQKEVALVYLTGGVLSRDVKKFTLFVHVSFSGEIILTGIMNTSIRCFVIKCLESNI